MYRDAPNGVLCPFFDRSSFGLWFLDKANYLSLSAKLVTSSFSACQTFIFTYNFRYLYHRDSSRADCSSGIWATYWLYDDYLALPSEFGSHGWCLTWKEHRYLFILFEECFLVLAQEFLNKIEWSGLTLLYLLLAFFAEIGRHTSRLGRASLECMARSDFWIR